MAQGNYDHPTYVARQLDFAGATTVGANGTSLVQGFPMAIRFRGFAATVATIGTAGAGTLNALSLVGTVTTTLASVALSSATATVNFTALSTDPNALIPVGGLLYFTNGADAVVKSNVTTHFHVDPSTGTWAAP